MTEYLPIERLTYKTKLTPREVVQRLEENTEPRKILKLAIYFGTSANKPYEGSFDNYSFKINRVIDYRNSFLPRITGKIEAEWFGSMIHTEMRLHPLVLLFVALWCGGLGLAVLASIIAIIFFGIFEAGMLVSLFMLLFGYSMTMGFFRYESNRAKEDLVQLFQAEIVEN